MTTRKFNELRDALYGESPESEARVAKKTAALVDEFGLAELRTRRSQTQADLAKVMATTQSAVSRLERQRDVLVSTLRDYVAATGGRLRVVAEYDDFDVELRLPIAAEPLPQEIARNFDVVWQNQETRGLIRVGELKVGSGRYEFSYTVDATLDPEFQPFAAFPSLDQTYTNDELFGFFKDRVVFSAKPGSPDVAAALGLRAQDATPVELLERSWGWSPHDTIQIVPRAVALPNGPLRRYFLVSGVSHVSGSAEHVARLIASLEPGQVLGLREEPDNPSNPKAVVVTAEGDQVGWIPNYLVDEVHKYRDQITIYVEHANAPPVPPHLRLLCRLDRELAD